MLGAWGRWVARHRVVVLSAALATVLAAGVWGLGVFGSLTNSGGFTDPSSESVRAATELESSIEGSRSDVVVVYRSTDGSTVDEGSFAADVQAAIGALTPAAVSSSTTYFDSGADAMVSTDRQATIATLNLVGEDEDARTHSYETVADELLLPGYETLRGGTVPVAEAVGSQVEADIVRAESITLPILGLLLVVVFGSVVAASLPWLIGGVAILGAFAALRLLTTFTEVSVFAVNVVTILGLGLAIDYALFMVSRFREELGDGRGREAAQAAVVRTVQTAGHTVLFSGLTVAVSLSALLFFPQVFLRSMGYGSIAAVLVAMTAALVILPAALALLGHRVDALRIRGYRGLVGGDGRLWARAATRVMRRPVVVVVATGAVLLALGSPFLGVQWGGVDARVLPETTESRLATEALADDFPADPGNVVDVLLTGTAPGPDVESYVAELAALPGATDAGLRGFDGADTVHVAVTYAGDRITDTATDLVVQVRDVPAPDGATALVGGGAAEHVDLLASMGAQLPWAAATVVLVTLVLLFLAFGSVVLPVKAVLMNVVSLAAVLGVLVWGFQEGRLADLLGFTSTGALEVTQPVLVLAIAFGLSTDYEVFLLSRIREHYQEHGDNEAAVRAGLARTGGIITSAALLLGVVMSGFLFSGISFIQTIGVGLVVGLALDAVVVRALLVPATMKLLGSANWWAPAPLAHWWQRHGMPERAPARVDWPNAAPVEGPHTAPVAAPAAPRHTPPLPGDALVTDTVTRQ